MDTVLLIYFPWRFTSKIAARVFKCIRGQPQDILSAQICGLKHKCKMRKQGKAAPEQQIALRWYIYIYIHINIIESMQPDVSACCPDNIAATTISCSFHAAYFCALHISVPRLTLHRKKSTRRSKSYALPAAPLSQPQINITTAIISLQHQPLPALGGPCAMGTLHPSLCNIWLSQERSPSCLSKSDRAAAASTRLCR